MLRERYITEFVIELTHEIDRLSQVLERRKGKTAKMQAVPTKKRKILLKYLELLARGMYNEQKLMTAKVRRFQSKRYNSVNKHMDVRRRRVLHSRKSKNQTRYNRLKKKK
ncbi:hypothetical protein NVP2275O_175 [Vibrio phage 2.275.O._10N.286.54.E11]|nr:hypothetical protein NVP2275O_175 [Vibrio phage 2.275.O._10N.286.54.E11]